MEVPRAAIAPGAHVGLPAAELHHETLNDFLHPALGPTLATESARAFIVSHHLTGVTFHPLEVRCAETSPNTTAPSLYAMDITANAWRIGVTPESIRVCDLCGRTKLPQDIAMRMDPSRSDNADFFTVDENPGQTYVSERAAKLLENSGLTNFRLRPIPISR